MALQDCLTEILLAIFQYLDPPDLASLSATSKAMHHIIEPHLYSTVQFMWTLDIQPSVMLLLRSYLERPELASLARNLTFAGTDGLLKDGCDAIILPLPNPPVLPHGLFDAVKRIGLSPSYADDCISRVQSGSADAVVAVLVSMTTGLKNLSLSKNWSAETQFLGRMFRSLLQESVEGDPRAVPSQKMHNFQSLTHVSITPWLNEYCVFETEEADRDILSLFYLPNIEGLSLSVANNVPFAWPFKQDPTPFALSSLELSRIRESQIEPILSAASNLTHLNYNWLFHKAGDTHMSKPTVNLSQLGGVLAKHGRALSELRIKARSMHALQWGCHEPPEVDFIGTLSGLSQLANIKKVQVPWIFVVDEEEECETPRQLNQILSESLEHLILTGDLGRSVMFSLPDVKVSSTLRSEFESGSLRSSHSLKVIQIPPSRRMDGLSQKDQDELARLRDQFSVEIGNLPRGFK